MAKQTKYKRKTDRPPTISAKQDLYCQEYARTGNSTKSAEFAGYNYPDRHGYALRQKPHILDKIQEYIDQRNKDSNVTAKMVINELWNIATFDLGELFNEDGKLKPILEIPKQYRKALSMVETRAEIQDGVKVADLTKIKVWDKIKALELIGKNLGMWIEKTETTNLNVNIEAETESPIFKKIVEHMTQEKPIIEVKPITLKVPDEDQ